MKKAAGLRLVEQKVADFHKSEQNYLTKAFQETETRNRFIDPLFQALGWDFEQTHLPRDEWDVHREYSQKERDTIKKPDYAFRVRRKPRFFVEAKAPHVPLTDKRPVFQAKKYAFSSHGRVPVIVITDFQEFRVFNAYQKPLYDNPLQGLIKDLDLAYTQYPAKWDLLWDTFSKEAVLDGSIDLLAKKVARNTKTLDDEFLTDLTAWRELLARNIAVRNPQLTADELNECVQRILDRFIFIRNLEDREIEHEDGLATIAETREGIYPALLPIFRTLDAEYNGLLFKKHLSEELTVDDEVLKKIIKAISPRTSPYQFDIIEPEILGRIYERFLGSKIRLTEGHRAKVEEKPEVRHAGGVYYTPQWVVDYIVEHTVGEKIKGKTPAEIETLKILDPACGSGSFLLGAFDRLIKYHEEWYGEHKKDKAHTRDWYQTAEGDIRLTVEKKGRILKNNLFGVDIDREATEVAIMSLYLKLLDKGFDKGQMMLLMKGTVLPDLTANIKCGNSLIGQDFYQGRQLDMFSDEDRKRINAFDWDREFPTIMKGGGFDMVIGNPPWGASFSEQELEYLRAHYSKVIARMIDSYIYFIARAITVGAPNSLLGLIVPSTILNQVDAQPVRELLLKRGLHSVLNLGQGIFGAKVLNTSTIFISGQPKQDKLLLGNFTGIPLPDRSAALLDAIEISWKEWNTQVEGDSHHTFFTGELDSTKLLQRLSKQHPPLSKIIAGTIQRGVSPDIVAAHVIAEGKAKSLKLEEALLKSSVSGPQIKRYRYWKADQNIIYTTRETPIKEYPKVHQYLEGFRKENTCKEVLEKKHPWWALHRPRDISIFNSPKFIGLTTSRTIELVYDQKSSVYVTDAMYIFSTIRDIDPFALMAIMQSKLFLFLYRVSNQGESRVIPQVKASKIEPLPLPEWQNSSKTIQMIGEYCRQMYKYNQQLIDTSTDHSKATIQRQIDAADRQIDQLVYELYGLTEKEIRIVDEASNE